MTNDQTSKPTKTTSAKARIAAIVAPASPAVVLVVDKAFDVGFTASEQGILSIGISAVVVPAAVWLVPNRPKR